MAPWVAAIVDGTIDSPIPAAVSSPGIITYTIAEPLSAIFVNSSIPPVIISSPEPSTARTPKRLTSLPALRATTMIVSAIGRNVRPACSGDRPSTCCRYSELTNHIGNSAALNSSTIVFALRSGLVSSLNGTRGAEAIRVSTTQNAASSAAPTMIGTSAADELQPFVPALTTP